MHPPSSGVRAHALGHVSAAALRGLALELLPQGRLPRDGDLGGPGRPQRSLGELSQGWPAMGFQNELVQHVNLRGVPKFHDD